MKLTSCFLFLFLCIAFDVSAQWKGLSLPEAPTAACDYCMCSQGLTPFEIGASGLRFEMRSMRLGDQFQGSQRQANPDNVNESYLTNQFSFFYHFAETPLTAVVNLPYVVRMARDYPEEGGNEIVSPSANGIGDVSLMLRATDQTSLDEAVIVLSATAGVKLPTGRTDLQFGDEFMDIDLQPGSGSTDWLLGVGAIWSMDRTTFGLNVLGGMTGIGARGHRYGDYINGEVSTRYRLVPNDISVSALFVTLGLGGELRAKELEYGTPLDASGGSIIYIAPGMQYHINESLMIDAKAEIPLNQYLNGEQFGESYRLIGGLQWLL